MVEISHLTYFYPGSEAPALRDLSLHLAAGGLHLVAGRSGSGKSTLLRALNGLVPRFYGGRFGGRVVVNGLDTRQAEPVEMAGQVGFVFQEPENHFITRNVADEIAFGMEVAGLSGETIRTRVAEIIERPSSARWLSAHWTASQAVSSKRWPWRRLLAVSRRFFSWTSPPPNWTASPPRRCWSGSSSCGGNWG
jgi:energy-coupling factor transporter ATP-binding protein EcfA2